MPFQSEKQRRYLWANEPEIARDWTDTYGSGIAKALGGRIPFQQGMDVHPEGDPYGFLNMQREKGIGPFKDEVDQYPYENWDPRKYIYPAVNWGVNQLTGIPGVGSAINFLSNAFEPNQVDVMNRGIVNQLGGMDPQTGRDPFGTNVVSWKGNYQQRQENIEDFYNNLDQDRLDRLMNIGWHKKRRDWATDYLKKNPIYQDWRRELGGNPDIIDRTPRRIPPTPTVITPHGGGGGWDRPNVGRNAPGRDRGQSPTGGDVKGTPFNRGGLAALWPR